MWCLLTVQSAMLLLLWITHCCMRRLISSRTFLQVFCICAHAYFQTIYHLWNLFRPREHWFLAFISIDFQSMPGPEWTVGSIKYWSVDLLKWRWECTPQLRLKTNWKRQKEIIYKLQLELQRASLPSLSYWIGIYLTLPRTWSHCLIGSAFSYPVN